MFIRLKKLASTFKPGVFHLALVDYLIGELKENKIKCKKQTSYIKIKLEGLIEDKYNHVVIDCFNGGVYLRGEGVRDKKVLKLVRFNGIRESDAMHCAKGGCKQILRCLEKLNKPKQLEVEAIIENGLNFIDMRKNKTIDMRRRNTIAKDMRKRIKISWHGDNSRNMAVCYIDGTIAFGKSHANCINKYLEDKLNISLNEDWFRPDTDDKIVYRTKEEQEWLDSLESLDEKDRKKYNEIQYKNLYEDGVDAQKIRDSISQLAFGHLDGKAIYLEEVSAVNVDLNTVANAIKNQYPEYDVYIDGETKEDYRKIAIKDLRKFVIVTDLRTKNSHRLKKVADMMGRDFAICIINGEVYEGDIHGEAVSKYLKSIGIDDIEIFDRDQIDDMIGLKSQFAAAEAKGNNIYIDSKTLENITLEQAAKLINNKYSNYTILNLDTNEKLACIINRLKKIADHDIGNRDLAIVYINGEFYEEKTHAMALSEYLESIGYDSLCEEFRRPDLINPNNNNSASDKKEIIDIQGILKEVAFGHKVFNEKAIYVEQKSLIGIDMFAAAEIFKNHYKAYDIYDDDTYDAQNDEYKLIAKLNKINRLKKIAWHDVSDRDCAIACIDNEVIEADTHALCVNKYLEEHYDKGLSEQQIRPNINIEVDDAWDEEQAQDLSNIYDNIKQIAFGHVDKTNKVIYLEPEGLNVTSTDLTNISKIVKEKYSDYNIYIDNAANENFQQVAKIN